MGLSIDKDIMNFEYTCGGCDRLFSNPVPVFYTHRTDHFLRVWYLLLPFCLYDAFQEYWNHVEMILLASEISIFSSGIEEFVVQLE